ncbi:MAG: hypothetical protein ABIH82_03145, partial [Candidatus Woesearchaeota archaeon]
WNLGGGFSQPEVTVVFNYDNNYPFTFQVTPTEGGKMKSGLLGGTDVLSNLCLQTWKFTYDATYPVLIKVRDDTTGYYFNVATTVHLLRNIPNRKGNVVARPETVFPENVNDEYCDKANILSTILTWETIDNDASVFDQQPLEGVNISFACINYACQMGETDFNFQQWGYQSGLSVNLPYCVGAILRGTKEGYKEDFQRIVTKSGAQYDLNLVPLYQFPLTKIKVVKHKFNGLENPAGQAELLGKNEMALIRMKSYKNGTLFHEIEEVVGGVMDEETAKRINVEFLGKASFNYEIEINVFNDENLIGGYKANWTLPWNNLETAQEIVFHTIYEGGSDENIYSLFSDMNKYSNYVPSPEVK